MLSKFPLTVNPVFRVVSILASASLLLMVPATFAQRTNLKPGWNLFSVQQDVAVGKQNAEQAERQLRRNAEILSGRNTKYSYWLRAAPLRCLWT